MNKTQLKNIVESLVLIEALAYNYENLTFSLDFPDRKLLRKSLEARQKTACNIYTLVHNATNHCEGCSSSDNIKKQVEKLKRRLKKDFKKSNFVDTNKKVKEIMEKLEGKVCA